MAVQLGGDGQILGAAGVSGDLGGAVLLQDVDAVLGIVEGLRCCPVCHDRRGKCAQGQHSEQNDGYDSFHGVLLLQCLFPDRSSLTYTTNIPYTASIGNGFGISGSKSSANGRKSENP